MPGHGRRGVLTAVARHDGDAAPGSGAAGRRPGVADPIAVSGSEALVLLARLVASAELCYSEPYDYGIFRLADAASRLAALLAAGAEGERRAWLEAYAARLEAGKMGDTRDREAYLAFLRGASREIADHLVARDRAGGSGGG